MLVVDSGHKKRKTKLLQLKINSSNCQKCQDLVKSRSRVVFGYGDLTAELLIIGEAPGRYGADQTGVPFTRDKSGILLQKILVKIGMNKNNEISDNPDLCNVYLTNIVRCNPKSADGTNRSPTKEEILNCSEYLRKEIQIINPKILIPLGVNASKLILGSKFSSKRFGRLLKHGSLYVFPLWHPAYVIRGGGRLKISAEKYTKYFIKLQNRINKMNSIQQAN